jgi:hypothetical protein
MPERRKALGRVSLPTFFLCTSKESRPLGQRTSGSLCSKKQNSKNWIPAFAGMTNKRAEKQLDSGFRRNDERKSKGTG